MPILHSHTGLPAAAQTRSVQDGTRPDRAGSDGEGRKSLTRSAAVVIAVTLQRLVDDPARSWSSEETLVLDALRRSTNNLNEASTEELAAYISGLTPEQLRGVVSNVKGIYHELLFVHAENMDGDEVTAGIFKATNHPGGDVEFLVDGDVIRVVQLKAVASADAIRESRERYPEIEVLATEEVASRTDLASSSGFSNEELGGKVQRVFGDLPGDSLATEIAEGAGTSALLAGALSAARVLRSGQVTRQQVSTAFGDVAVGVVAATALDVLLDGLS